ncbi:hypothetical protein GCK32_011044 [Trichostrongylus colubriformis]|uniref:Uncharacterized protein n=1 Tax=Trichostrongylus colubriformis TaxID=6319 RepID=A0AAN8FW84_TRICO
MRRPVVLMKKRVCRPPTTSKSPSSELLKALPSVRGVSSTGNDIEWELQSRLSTEALRRTLP